MSQARPTLRRSEKILPAVPDDSPEDPPDVIVAQWQRLASMDPQSPDFLPLLSSLTTDDDRSPTIKFCGDDARVTLGVIDEVSSAFVVKAMTYVTPFAQVLKGGKIPGEYAWDTLRTMRTLAYNSGQLPLRYQVDRRSLSVEGGVIASGAFADVREGRLGGKVVAVRTLRTDRQTDHYEAQKVCVASNSLAGLTNDPSI